MGLSGLVGAGAQAGLEDLLARQLAEQQMQLRIKALEAEEADRAQARKLQERQIASLDADREFRHRLAAEKVAQAQAAAQAEAVREQANAGRRTNASLALQMPGLTPEQQNAELEGIAMRAGPTEGKTFVDLLKLRREETPEQKAERELGQYRKRKEIDRELDPPQAPAPRQPSFVTMPDGSVVDVMGVAPKGSTPYQRPVREKLTPVEATTQTRMLRNSYQREVATTREIRRQAQMMQAGMDAAKRGDLAAGSQAVLVTFQKILDPTSVVRESEYARSASGQAMLSRMEGAVDRIAKGGAGVPLAELQKFADMAQSFVQNATENEQAVRDHYINMAREFDLNPDLIVGGSPAPRPAPAGGSGSTLAPGTEGVVNGIPAVWDGKGWKPK